MKRSPSPPATGAYRRRSAKQRSARGPHEATRRDRWRRRGPSREVELRATSARLATALSQRDRAGRPVPVGLEGRAADGGQQVAQLVAALGNAVEPVGVGGGGERDAGGGEPGQERR